LLLVLGNTLSKYFVLICKLALKISQRLPSHPRHPRQIASAGDWHALGQLVFASAHQAKRTWIQPRIFGFRGRQGIDRNFVSLLERGLNQPSLTTIFKIAKALQVDPAYMLKEVQNLSSK
jgi:transcriptional regulator with XRE-family HTH domain